jgi:hypothetical protein
MEEILNQLDPQMAEFLIAATASGIVTSAIQLSKSKIAEKYGWKPKQILYGFSFLASAIYWGGKSLADGEITGVVDAFQDFAKAFMSITIGASGLHALFLKKSGKLPEGDSEMFNTNDI